MPTRHWMLGNTPDKTPEGVAPGYDVRREPDEFEDEWKLTSSPGRISPGDMFVIYSHPEDAFVAVGVFTSRARQDGWADVTGRKLRTPIRRRQIERRKAWRTSTGGYRKPFSRNNDGTPNKQFASPVSLDGGRWDTIWEHLTPSEQRWLKRASARAAGS